MSETRRIQVFRAGTFTDMSGQTVAFSDADVSDICRRYDVAAAPAPVVVGHPKSDSPAFGWAKKFECVGGMMEADIGDLAPAFVEAVKAGSYKKISMSFFGPDHASNPRPGGWYPKHIGFLGGAAPAVPGLQPVAFGGDDKGIVTIEFGEPAFRDVASLLRSLRDHLIEKEGLEVADRILPAWALDGVASAADEDDEDEALPAYSEPEKAKMNDLTQREAALREREAALASREAEARAADNLAFAEKMVAEGRLLPANRDKLVAVLSAELPASVSFADGGGTKVMSGAELLRDLIASQPAVVDYGRVDTGQPVAPAAEFAAPDGKAVDKEGLEIVGKAQQYMRRHRNVSFIEAVKAVS